jgi:hypothetical protein
MALKDLLKKIGERNGRLKEIQEEMRLQKMAEDRLKTADERELERFLKEKRQAQIKSELVKFRKEKNDDFWTGHSILRQPNIFKGDGMNILKQKNIFAVEHNKGMFFK